MEITKPVNQYSEAEASEYCKHVQSEINKIRPKSAMLTPESCDLNVGVCGFRGSRNCPQEVLKRAEG